MYFNKWNNNSQSASHFKQTHQVWIMNYKLSKLQQNESVQNLGSLLQYGKIWKRPIWRNFETNDSPTSRSWASIKVALQKNASQARARKKVRPIVEEKSSSFSSCFSDCPNRADFLDGMTKRKCASAFIEDAVVYFALNRMKQTLPHFRRRRRGARQLVADASLCSAKQTKSCNSLSPNSYFHY